MIVVLPAQVKLGEGGHTRRSRAKPYTKQYDKKETVENPGLTSVGHTAGQSIAVRG
jgi:hypothetical protein